MKRKNLKKMVFLAVIIGFTSTAWSQNFYLGIGAGPQFADFNINSTVVQPGSFNVNNNARLSGTGAFGSIFGGSAWTHQSLFVAVEANANLSNVISKTSNVEFIHTSESSANYRLRRTFGVSVLPGYLWTPTTLFYGRVGYAVSYFNISTTDVSINNMNRNIAGIRFGLGINQTLVEHVAARMEYSQIYYQSTSTTAVDTLSSTTKNTNIATTTGQVEFGLVYSFS